MAIAYINRETGEPVEKERWRWQAIYADGTELNQFDIDENGAVFHPFAAIDMAKVQTFKLVHDTLRPVVAAIPKGAKLVHAYTIRKSQHMTADGEFMYEETYKAYKFGYQLNGADYGLYVDHDDSIHLLSDFQQITPGNL